MVVLCGKCRLEVCPSGNLREGESSGICTTQCGHVFHTVCLFKFWNEYRQKWSRPAMLFPCPVCTFKYCYEVFELYLSKKEDTSSNKNLIGFHETFKIFSLKPENFTNGLEETNNDIAEMNQSMAQHKEMKQSLTKGQAEPKEEYTESFSQTYTINKNFLFETFSSGNATKAKKFFELKTSSEDSGQKLKQQMYIENSQIVQPPERRQEELTNAAAAASSSEPEPILSHNLRIKKRVCYKQ